jgi:hypothetical protein
MEFELNLPSPLELLNKQDVLEQKELWVKNKLKEIELKEKKLEQELEQEFNKIEKEREELGKQLIVNNQKNEELELFESKLIELSSSLNNKLAKVDEKINWKNFMLKCFLRCDNISRYNDIKTLNYAKKYIDGLVSDDEVYIVYIVKEHTIITNQGHVFLYSQYNSQYMAENSYYYYYLDILSMNENILNLIKVTLGTDDAYQSGYAKPLLIEYAFGRRR